MRIKCKDVDWIQLAQNGANWQVLLHIRYVRLP
jgi:hypothetical protein